MYFYDFLFILYSKNILFDFNTLICTETRFITQYIMFHKLQKNVYSSVVGWSVVKILIRSNQ